MSKHWTEYKRNATSASYAGCHFFAHVADNAPNDFISDKVAAKCPCGWMVEHTGYNVKVDDAMLAEIAEHYETHNVAATEVN